MAIDKEKINKEKYPDARTIKETIMIHEYLGYTEKELKLVCSPLRPDRNPSFSVYRPKGDTSIQLAHDISSGETWDVIKLHMKITGADFPSAIVELKEGRCYPPKELAGWNPFAHCRKGHRKATGKPLDPDVGVRSGRPIAGANYLTRNHLIVPEWMATQLDMYLDKKGNLSFLATTKEKGDCYHGKGNIRHDGSTFVTWTGGTAGYSICGNPESKEIFIYEGIGDCLALLILSQKLATAQHIILNSTSSINHLLNDFESREDIRVNLVLDQDAGGDEGTAKLLEGFQTKGIPARDIRKSVIPEGVKDVKDAYHLWLEKQK